jgi:hypothetical protein
MRGGGDLDFGRDGAWERSRRASGARWMRCFGGAFFFFFLFLPVCECGRWGLFALGSRSCPVLLFLGDLDF